MRVVVLVGLARKVELRLNTILQMDPSVEVRSSIFSCFASFRECEGLLFPPRASLETVEKRPYVRLCSRPSCSFKSSTGVQNSHLASSSQLFPRLCECTHPSIFRLRVASLLIVMRVVTLARIAHKIKSCLHTILQKQTKSSRRNACLSLSTVSIFARR
jgi:hypothetical protein